MPPSSKPASQRAKTRKQARQQEASTETPTPAKLKLTPPKPVNSSTHSTAKSDSMPPPPKANAGGSVMGIDVKVQMTMDEKDVTVADLQAIFHSSDADYMRKHKYHVLSAVMQADTFGSEWRDGVSSQREIQDHQVRRLMHLMGRELPDTKKKDIQRHLLHQRLGASLTLKEMVNAINYTSRTKHRQWEEAKIIKKTQVMSPKQLLSACFILRGVQVPYEQAPILIQDPKDQSGQLDSGYHRRAALARLMNKEGKHKHISPNNIEALGWVFDLTDYEQASQDPSFYLKIRANRVDAYLEDDEGTRLDQIQTLISAFWTSEADLAAQWKNMSPKEKKELGDARKRFKCFMEEHIGTTLKNSVRMFSLIRNPVSRYISTRFVVYGALRAVFDSDTFSSVGNFLMPEVSFPDLEQAFKVGSAGLANCFQFFCHHLRVNLKQLDDAFTRRLARSIHSNDLRLMAKFNPVEFPAEFSLLFFPKPDSETKDRDLQVPAEHYSVAELKRVIMAGMPYTDEKTGVRHEVRRPNFLPDVSTEDYINIYQNNVEEQIKLTDAATIKSVFVKGDGLRKLTELLIYAGRQEFKFPSNQNLPDFVQNGYSMAYEVEEIYGLDKNTIASTTSVASLKTDADMGVLATATNRMVDSMPNTLQLLQEMNEYYTTHEKEFGRANCISPFLAVAHKSLSTPQQRALIEYMTQPPLAGLIKLWLRHGVSTKKFVGVFKVLHANPHLYQEESGFIAPSRKIAMTVKAALNLRWPAEVTKVMRMEHFDVERHANAAMDKAFHFVELRFIETAYLEIAKLEARIAQGEDNTEAEFQGWMDLSSIEKSADYPLMTALKVELREDVDKLFKDKREAILVSMKELGIHWIKKSHEEIMQCLGNPPSLEEKNTRFDQYIIKYGYKGPNPDIVSPARPTAPPKTKGRKSTAGSNQGSVKRKRTEESDDSD